METAFILKAAVTTVGTVELIKNFIPKKLPKWALTLLAGITGTILCLPFIPEWVFNVLLVVSGATLFYDTILKTFKKMFIKEEDNEQ